MITRSGAVPWQHGKADYLAALTGPSIALGHTIGETPWDLHLEPSVNERKRAFHEESHVRPRQSGCLRVDLCDDGAAPEDGDAP